MAHNSGFLCGLNEVFGSRTNRPLWRTRLEWGSRLVPLHRVFANFGLDAISRRLRLTYSYMGM
jgi:hypothetical protein